jgi:hypothetical protein
MDLPGSFKLQERLPLLFRAFGEIQHLILDDATWRALDKDFSRRLLQDVAGRLRPRKMRT